MNAAKKYLNFGGYIRPVKGTDVLVAAFLFQHAALNWVRSQPSKSNAIVRWIGIGRPPDEEHVTDGEHYL